MRAIRKESEPESLASHRRTQHSNYDNYLGKDELRAALAAEQRGLCCYCMSRIRNGPTTMKVEHWQCQTRYPDRQLRYKNLLGACIGGQGLPGRFQHCDTRKGDRDLKWSPAERSHQIETRLRYELDGSIRSDDARFNAQLDDVLNLNLPRIKNNRKSVLTALLEWWKSEQKVSRQRIEKEIQKRVTSHADLSPYCQVSIWWLRQKLARMT